jgi:hypothetical protein
MDKVVWVEILSRQRAVLARHRFTGAEIGIGRSYVNDLVLDDPTVAAQHLRIRRDESGALVAEDIGSANGMFVDGASTRSERVALDGERVIRIGQSQLRIREASYPVPRERLLKGQRHDWPLALGLAAVVLALETLLLWLAETNAVKAVYYLTPLLGIVALVGIWTAVWAAACRIFSGQARFETNLAVALAGLLSISLFDIFARTTGFALSWQVPTAYSYVAIYGIVAAVAFCHLRMIGATRVPHKAGVVAALALLAVAVHTLAQREAHADIGQQNYARFLLPPAFRLKPPTAEGDFFAAVAQLKDALDRDRAETPPADQGPPRPAHD